MLIKNLFNRDIFRFINGVVKADQTDEGSISQELDEYVVTKELDKHFRDFFSPFIDSINNRDSHEAAGKVGVWVSGFFGSGKSHFIKILSYLLKNQTVAFHGNNKQAIEFFQDKIHDQMLIADMKRAVSSNTDVVLFNIDSKADNSSGRDAILTVFLKVFNEMQGYDGDHPHIAHFERYLDEKGKLEEFHKVFEEISDTKWIEEREFVGFNQDEIIKASAQVLGQSEQAQTSWFENAKSDYSVTVENFSRLVKKYLDSKGSDHRIIFLVDEIGQFIGQDTHLMLNLQTIVENLGTICGGRAWVVVTSQEDIDSILGEVTASKANDFSKIQGRFRTRLSLSSADVSEVIQARLLSKVDGVTGELESLYASKEDILNNQLSFTNAGMTFKTYQNHYDFVKTYPFVPYQFQLVQKIFEVIRKMGATGMHLARGERSMLDAFQLAAQEVSDENVGILVPLYRFYPSIESFLETSIKKTIDQAKNNPVLEPFDIEILRTLFLIRYVDELKGNINNLVTLCIDQIDADKITIEKAVEESLQRLEKETLINRNGEDYFFLTNEERDISSEIKVVELSGGEEAKLIGQLIYEDVLKENRKYRYPVNQKDFSYTRLCDQHPVGSQVGNDLVVSFITPLSDEYGFYKSEGKCINQSLAEGGQVLIRLDDDETLGRELRTFLKTEKYVSRNNDGALPTTTKRIILDRIDENRQRRERLTVLVRRLVEEASYFAIGQSLSPKGGGAISLVENSLNYLIENTFSKLGYITKITADPLKEIQAVLRTNDIQPTMDLTGGENNPDAVAELRQFIDLSSTSNKQIILHNVVEKFSGRPYGWPEWETILLLSRVLVFGEINLIMDSSTLQRERVFEAVRSTNKWRRIQIVQRKTVDTATLQKARSLGKDVFGEMGGDGEDALYKFLTKRLVGWKESLGQCKPLAETGDYPGLSEIKDGLKLIEKLLYENESYEFIKGFNAQKNDLLDLSDNIHDIEHFYQKQKPTWEKLRTAYQEFQPNRKALDKDSGAATALSRMETILKSAEPYNMIKESEALIQKVRVVNSAEIEERRSRAFKIIDGRIDEIKKDLESVKTDSHLSNSCLLPIQNIRKDVEKQTSIAHIFQAQREAEEAFENAISKIEEAAKVEPPKPVNPPVGVGGNKPSPVVTPKPVFKKRCVIDARKLVGKTYMETDQDVENFLGTLRTKLKQAISNNEKIEIK